jgi:hypothetical protein
LQTDSDFAGFIISELNAGLFKDVLYLEDRGEVSCHDSFILPDPLEGRQPRRRGRRPAAVLVDELDTRGTPGWL